MQVDDAAKFKLERFIEDVRKYSNGRKKTEQQNPHPNTKGTADTNKIVTAKGIFENGISGRQVSRGNFGKKDEARLKSDLLALLNKPNLVPNSKQDTVKPTVTSNTEKTNRSGDKRHEDKPTRKSEAKSTFSGSDSLSKASSGIVQRTKVRADNSKNISALVCKKSVEHSKASQNEGSQPIETKQKSCICQKTLAEEGVYPLPRNSPQNIQKSKRYVKQIIHQEHPFTYHHNKEPDSPEHRAVRRLTYESDLATGEEESKSRVPNFQAHRNSYFAKKIKPPNREPSNTRPTDNRRTYHHNQEPTCARKLVRKSNTHRPPPVPPTPKISMSTDFMSPVKESYFVQSQPSAETFQLFKNVQPEYFALGIGKSSEAFSGPSHPFLESQEEHSDPHSQDECRPKSHRVTWYSSKQEQPFLNVNSRLGPSTSTSYEEPSTHQPIWHSSEDDFSRPYDVSGYDVSRRESRAAQPRFHGRQHHHHSRDRKGGDPDLGPSLHRHNSALPHHLRLDTYSELPSLFSDVGPSGKSWFPQPSISFQKSNLDDRFELEPAQAQSRRYHSHKF